jgi:hypothetical protein
MILCSVTQKLILFTKPSIDYRLLNDHDTKVGYKIGIIALLKDAD